MRWTISLLLVCGGCAEEPCDVGAVCLEARSYSLGARTKELAVADVDGDGRVDIVGLGESSANVRLSRGDGAFAGPTVWQLPGQARGLSLADHDGDGRLELTTAMPELRALAALPFASGGELGSARTVDMGAAIGALAAADFDGDGLVDLAAAERDAPRLHLLRGSSRGLTRAGSLAVEGEITSLAVGRFLADRAEVALAMPSAGVVGIADLSGKAPSLRRVARRSAFPQAVAAGDVDGDGRTDLAVADGLERAVWLGIGDGDTTWFEEHVWAVADAPAWLVPRGRGEALELAVASQQQDVLARIDARSGAQPSRALFPDGLVAAVAVDLDPAVGEELVYTDRNLRTHMVREVDGFAVRSRWHDPETTPLGRVAMADVDGDGVAELVGEDLLRGELVVHAATDAGYAPRARLPLPGPLSGLRGLPRGDGGTDMVFWTGDSSAPGRLTLVGEGPDGLAELATVDLGGPIIDVVAADFDGDGWADAAVTTWSATEQELLHVRRAPDLGLVEEAKIVGDRSIDAVLAVELDGDGRDDLWIVRGHRVWRFASTTGEPQELPGVWSGARGWATADLDDDGFADLMACSDNGVLVGAGGEDGALAEPTSLDSYYCDRVHVCDVDGDGGPELVVEVGLFGGEALGVVRQAGDGSWDLSELLPGAREDGGSVARCEGDELSLWTGGTLGGELLAVGAGPALRRVELDAKLALHSWVGDVDGDGFDDLVTNDTRALIVALADGRDDFGPARRIELDGTVSRIDLGEFDGRAGVELLVRSRESGADEFAWRLGSVRGGTLVTGAPLAGLGDSPWFADFDGDGRAEFVTGLFGDAPELWTPAYAGAPERRVKIDLPASLSRVRWRALDVDDDGRVDLVHLEAGLEVYRSLGQGRFAAAKLWPITFDEEVWSVGDLDGDGAADLVAARGDTITSCFGDGAGGPRGACREVDWPESDQHSPPAPLLHDLDGDGAIDLLWLFGDALSVVHGDGAGGFRSTTRWPLGHLSGDEPLVPARVGPGATVWVSASQRGTIVLRERGGR